MRGNRGDCGRYRQHAGSIPAHAGEPRRLRTIPAARRVYPRACGGTMLEGTGTTPEKGLSPRMRGNHRLDGREILVRGSIPAHAGEPPQHPGAGQALSVYPRACGGTTIGVRSHGTSSGLSPRMRGNRLPRLALPDGRGSIPAHAGEPETPPESEPDIGVYPRACGGTTRRLQ